MLIGSAIASASIIRIYGFTTCPASVITEKSEDAECAWSQVQSCWKQKMVRIGPWKKMRFGNEVPEGFVVVDFVDFLHDSANFKQAWFALAALEVL